MSLSSDIPLGTVGTFRNFPRSEFEFEPLRLEENLEASNSSNIWSKLWKIVWRGVAVTVILVLLGYGLIQYGSANSGSVRSNAATTTMPMLVWSAEASTFSPETSTSETIERTTEYAPSMTTTAPTTAEVLKLNLTTPFNPIATVTLSELARANKWCPWGMNNERCNRFHDQFTSTSSTTVEPPASQTTFSAEFCAGQIGNQTYLEVKWLCQYCHRRASVWNKTEWRSDSFPSTCASNCFDNPYRRACAKRAFEWNQKTGEFGSPFTCKHC